MLILPVLVWAQLPYRFCKVIDLDSLQEPTLVAVALDSDIYEVTQENYADVRIVDGDGVEVAYLLDPLDFQSGANLPEKHLYTGRHYNVAGFEVVQSQNGRETQVLVQSRREPWTALILEVGECNFRRSARVEAVGSGRRILVKGELSCLHLGGIRKERMELSFPEQRCAQYRVIIENEGSPPLKVKGVRALGNVHRLFFIAEPGKSYRLYYGGRMEERPRYDAFAIEEASRHGLVLKLARLGEQVVNENYVEPPRFWFRNRWSWSQMGLLFLAVLAVLLCWSLYYTAKRVRWSSAGQKGNG
jgi:hypothetical protein